MDERSLFLQALEQSDDQRSTWLQQQCGDDNELRKRIETLLQQHEKANSFLEQPAPGLAATIAPRRCPTTAECVTGCRSRGDVQRRISGRGRRQASQCAEGAG